MKVDYLIKNGKTLNVDTMAFEPRDIAVDNGVIVPSQTGLEAAHVIDAKGKYVLPGLVDEHMHLNYGGSNISVNPDLACIPMGITTALDAGSCGWINFDSFCSNVIPKCSPSVYAYVNVSPLGVQCRLHPEENMNTEDFDEREILNCFRKHPEVTKGIKVRLTTATLGDYDIEPLRRGMEIAKYVEDNGYKCLVAVHYDNLPPQVTVREILDLLRPGDIFTHYLQVHKETVFDEAGHVRDIVRGAQARGVLMDTGNSGMHWSIKHIKQSLEDGFYPDIISSDVGRYTLYKRPSFSLIYHMCVLSACGLDEKEIIKRVTYNPAKALGILDKAGTLEIGRPADICIMDIRDSDDTLEDLYGGTVKANKMFVPLLTMKAGYIHFRQIFF